MYRNKSVNVHQFSMVPRADIPRSGFKIETSHKTTFDAGLLIPIYLQEVLPGDTFAVNATIFGRLATPIVPVMDNLTLESFFFFVPNRLLWENWHKFCGEQDDPGDSVDFVIPTVSSAAGGFAALSIYDYMGLPTEDTASAVCTVNALPLRAYNLIWKEWFRDENLQNSPIINKDDGPDSVGNYALLRRGKRHDYFTSCLPWVQKFLSVPLPLGQSAPVVGIGTASGATWGSSANVIESDGNPATYAGSISTNTANAVFIEKAASGNFPSIFADLTQATASTINQIRQAFQVQKLLERDARGGTRYTEIVKSHFGVTSPDARLQRPEYLGGGSTPINIHPVAQTSGTADGTGGYTPTPQGNLSGFGTVLASRHGFSQSFTEHGYILGLVSVRADLNYQQGLRKLWSRRTRFDFYWPVFAMLGEQAVLNKEIYFQGTVDDDAVFGYQERWAEYRHHPTIITGLFRSQHPQTLDVWHLAQNFTALPTLSAQFIEDNPPVDRIVATTPATGQQFIADMFFSAKVARPMPMYSVPGLIDHF